MLGAVPDGAGQAPWAKTPRAPAAVRAASRALGPSPQSLRAAGRTWHLSGVVPVAPAGHRENQVPAQRRPGPGDTQPSVGARDVRRGGPRARA